MTMIFSPDLAIQPGVTIEREVTIRWLSKKEVASRLDVSEKHLIDIIKGDVAITPQLALKLEYVFGVSAKSWLQMDTSYQETKARIAEKEMLAKEKDLYSEFCNKNITYIIKRGWIKQQNKMEDKIREVKSFMWVSLLKSIQSLYWQEKYYRQSLSFEKKVFALSLWLRLGEKICEEQTVTSFSKNNVKKLITELKPLLKNDRPDIEYIQALCNTYGIYFVFVEENFDKVPVKGVVRYYNDNPLIQLSNKWNRTDIFWFNLFHELGHIVHHLGKKMTFLDIDWKEVSNEQVEREADQFALDTMISAEQYETVQQNPSKMAILRLGKSIAVHPSIIAGRLASDPSVHQFSFTDANKFRTKVIA